MMIFAGWPCAMPATTENASKIASLFVNAVMPRSSDTAPNRCPSRAQREFERYFTKAAAVIQQMSTAACSARAGQVHSDCTRRRDPAIVDSWLLAIDAPAVWNL